MADEQKRAVLANSIFGQRIAEDEGDLLSTYFVFTDDWNRLWAGDIDIVYGAKGSGKSALYSLLIRNTNELFEKDIILSSAENPRGAPAFSDIVTDPPISEREFVNLWKLYVLSLLQKVFSEYGIEGDDVETVNGYLAELGLVEKSQSLKSILRTAWEYVKSFRPSGIETEMKLDPNTQMPAGIAGRITFSEPTVQAKSKHGLIDVDSLLTKANSALENYGKYKVWILFDRLDVAFAESSDLEKNALRALFKVYLDMAGLGFIKLKIFLRTDIWNRITEEGFREASHIVRHVTLDWSANALLNLIVKRVISNDQVVEYYDVNVDDVLSDFDEQQDFFYTVFPDQVDVGAKKPTTFDWMLTRTRDGTGKNTPRELIHFLNALRETQIRKLEIGESEPEGKNLFSRNVFKVALADVSSVRLSQTLYAEYPEYRKYIELLRGEKSSQVQSTLAATWKEAEDEALKIARHLVTIGFMEERGSRERPEFWIPFIYRDALDLVQGSADN